MNKLILSSLTIFLLASCSNNEAKFAEEDGLNVFNADSLKKHIAVLASDDFMGRKPFTEGETKTVAYLQEQFKQMGLEPGNGESYIQEVPMANILATAAPSLLANAASKKSKRERLASTSSTVRAYSCLAAKRTIPSESPGIKT